MKSNKGSDMIVIFSGSPIEAGMVKSLLKDSEIEAFLKDENMGTIAPWHVTAGGIGAVKVVISSLDHKKAELVIEEYYKNSNSNAR